MSLSAAAAAMGLPEDLVQRSAEARAAETGASVEAILTAWAGGTEAPAAPVNETVAEPSVEAVTPEPAQVELPEVVAAAEVETPVGAGVPVATRAPVPSEVTRAEASQVPEVVTVPTAGIKERTNFVIPKWLTGLMVIVPLFALFALGGASTGACGEATELATDVITGEIVNCDGTEFTGGGLGGGGTDYIALGGDIYAGTAVTGVNCSGCHGATGQGSGAFPALTGVLTTFGACTDHVDWVTLGSAGYTEAGSYGDTAKPVNGGMPSFGSSLTPEQVAAVSAFERVRFGGSDQEQALADCGLAESSETDGLESDGPTGTDAVEGDVEASG